MKKRLVLSVIVVGFIFGGCSQKIPEIDNQNAVVTTNPNGAWGKRLENDGSNVDSNIDQMSQMDSENTNISYGSIGERISAVKRELQAIYFATDSYKIDSTQRDKVKNDVAVLNGELASDLKVKIEGNCDEWGTDEYNYALGLKRAKSTKNALMSEGVDMSRMSIISYGESKPACSEHNPSCWQQNRRADFELFQ
jgi:peptidoglycan-associated lipoprotein